MTEYSEVIPKKRGHYVYRLWAVDGTCLYVGCAGEREPRRVSERLSDHRRKKSWWPQVARIDIATFATASEVVAEEPRQITALQPVHNIAHKNRWTVNRENEYKHEREKAPEVRERIRERAREWRQRPDVREYRRQHDRRRPSGWERGRTARRRPSPGQEGLWT